ISTQNAASDVSPWLDYRPVVSRPYLYDPNGTLVFGDNANSYLAVVTGQRLTRTGTYTFVVVEDSWAGTYDYLLSLTKVAGGVNRSEARRVGKVGGAR